MRGDAGLVVVTPEQMRELGRALAELLQAGDLVVLSGPLGAGKTVLAQGIGAGLGVTSPVTSPTFVIARVHRCDRLPLVHVDAYRLAGAAEVDDLDLDTTLADAVTVVEWGAGLVEGLADARLQVSIEFADDDAQDRVVRLTAYGQRWAGIALPSCPPGEQIGIIPC